MPAHQHVGGKQFVDQDLGDVDGPFLGLGTPFRRHRRSRHQVKSDVIQRLSRQIPMDDQGIWIACFPAVDELGRNASRS
jgi:hypothetical protein